jgi:hypothetical protein
MESSDCRLNEERCDADGRSGWGWLAAAVLAGVMMGRGYRKSGVLFGVGLVLLKCCGDRNRVEDQKVEAPVLAGRDEGSDEVPAESKDDQSEQGGWLLGLEPVPLVVRDSLSAGSGQGGELLGQGPGQTMEELEWSAPESGDALWMNEGAEIPDAVELPELGGKTGANTTGSAGV